MSKILVDDAEVKVPFEVTFILGPEKIKAIQAVDGFIVPKELMKRESISTSMSFGKYVLNFEVIPIEKFRESWTIEVDKKPFSAGRVSGRDRHRVKLVYVLQFSTGELIFRVYEK